MLSTTKIPEKLTVWSCCGTNPKARRTKLQEFQEIPNCFQQKLRKYSYSCNTCIKHYFLYKWEVYRHESSKCFNPHTTIFRLLRFNKQFAFRKRSCNSYFCTYSLKIGISGLFSECGKNEFPPPVFFILLFKHPSDNPDLAPCDVSLSPRLD
jgi:hypothetical protein